MARNGKARILKVLTAIKEARPGQLARVLRYTVGWVQRELDDLERRGLVERRYCPDTRPRGSGGHARYVFRLVEQ